MAVKTFRLKVDWKGQRIEFLAKAAQADIEHLSHELGNLTRITRWWRELKGFTDEPGTLDSGYMTQIFSTDEHPVPDQASYEADVQAILAQLPTGEQVLNGPQVKALAAQCRPLFFKHLPIKDCRVDREVKKAQDIASNEAHLKYEAARKAAWAEFAEVWVEGGAEAKPIVIPDGMQAIYLSFNYDNSDAMTDYYAPHAGVPDMQNLLLQLADAKRPQTEKLAREALAHYPGLLALTQTEWDKPEPQPIAFKWDTQNYSMGHGNFLQSGVVMHLTLNEGGEFEKEIGVHLEVEFAKGNYTKIYPISNAWRQVPQPQEA